MQLADETLAKAAEMTLVEVKGVLVRYGFKKNEIASFVSLIKKPETFVNDVRDFFLNSRTRVNSQKIENINTIFLRYRMAAIISSSSMPVGSSPLCLLFLSSSMPFADKARCFEFFGSPKTKILDLLVDITKSKNSIDQQTRMLKEISFFMKLIANDSLTFEQSQILHPALRFLEISLMFYTSSLPDEKKKEIVGTLADRIVNQRFKLALAPYITLVALSEAMAVVFDERPKLIAILKDFLGLGEKTVKLHPLLVYCYEPLREEIQISLLPHYLKNILCDLLLVQWPGKNHHNNMF